MALETSLLIFKPDAVQRGLTGTLLARLEAKGLHLAGMKLIQPAREQAEAHYAEHRDKPFFDGLIGFFTSGPVVVLAVQGVDAIAVCRTLIGATNGRKAAPGTLRGDFGMSGAQNLVHGSDSGASAERELGIWFPDGDLLDHRPDRLTWIYDPSDLD